MRKSIIILFAIGAFFNLLSQSEKKNSDSIKLPKLKSKYNMMKNIKLEKSKKYDNSKNYQLVENGIYKDLNDKDDTPYRMMISYELESDNTNNQYPLEDILDKYLMYVSDFMESENIPKSSKFKIELGGYLEDMKKAKIIIGKKVYNRDIIDKDGKVRVELVIE